ncbi:MAG: RimK family protein, partial [Bilophila sp.]
MKILIVAYGAEKWNLSIPGVEIITPRRYITDPRYASTPGTRVLNLSRSYRYQSNGYYVSLLAAARGHRPMPSVSTMRDLQGSLYSGYVDGELDDIIQKNFAPLAGESFTLSIYFGRNLAKRYEKLSLKLFNMLTAPLLRAFFIKTPQGKWHLKRISAIALSEVPDDHRPFMLEAMQDYCARPLRTGNKRPPAPFSLAMLINPHDPMPPSNAGAVEQFIRAGAKLGIDVELIHKDDYTRLLEYDALFIRDTTQVNNHTYRFARRAEIEGMPCIDDSQSILRCTNKVYLAELLAHNHIKTPKTTIVHSDNIHTAHKTLGFPCILKQPDSAFSLGVIKVATPEAFCASSEEMLEKSDLIIAQEFLPTDFDWRIGVLAGEPLFACKYYMAEHHWQIYNKSGKTDDDRWGMTETFALADVPPHVLKTALDAANLIGDGLYGVDLKEINGVPYIIEVNDNPSLDAGIEDEVLGQDLYLRIMQVFR